MDDGRTRCRRKCQSLLADGHHQRVAGGPGAGCAFPSGIGQGMLATIAVITYRDELENGGWGYGIQIGAPAYRPMLSSGIATFDSQPVSRIRYSLAIAASASLLIKA